MASYEKIINYIDKMYIYEKEYNVIQSLINAADPKFFTKVLEEVVDGNLYWIDFYPILDTPEYKDLLSRIFETQEQLAYEISNLKTFRESISKNNKNMSYEKTLGLTADDNNYNEENERLRENYIYDILQRNAKDDILTTACKMSVYNAINNYFILKADMESKDKTPPINDAMELVIVDDENNAEYFDYMNPDDILISADNMIIPIDCRYQVLDSSDRTFMIENDLSEDQMKQFKALRKFIKNNTGGDG